MESIKEISKKYIDGMTLIGVGLTAFALRGENVFDWSYWVMLIPPIILLVMGIVHMFFNKKSYFFSFNLLRINLTPSLINT